MPHQIRLTAAVAAMALCGLASSCSHAVAAPVADSCFVQRMIPHHHLGAEMADLAMAKADDVRVRHLAFDMGSYHGPELRLLQSWSRRWAARASSCPPPEGMLDETRLQSLRDASGAAFDQLFLLEMIDHHEGAVSMTAEEVSVGSLADVRNLAAGISAVQNAQIEAMTALRVAPGVAGRYVPGGR